MSRKKYYASSDELTMPHTLVTITDIANAATVDVEEREQEKYIKFDALEDVETSSLSSFASATYDEPQVVELAGDIDDYWRYRKWLSELGANDQIEVHVQIETSLNHILAGSTSRSELADPDASRPSLTVNSRTSTCTWHEIEQEALALTFSGPDADSRRHNALQLLRTVSPRASFRNAGRKALVVCNAYPSEQQIYRNGFIHTRVKHYVEAGLDVEVFYLHPPATSPYRYNFEGIDVHVGNRDSYQSFLSQNSHECYLVHFANPDMIEPLQERHPEAPTIIWIHGFESEAWHRRWFNFLGSPNEIREALAKKTQHFDIQQKFNRGVYANPSNNIQFVNVSEWFKRSIVEPDSGVELEQDHVIPNMVDTSHFHYLPKTVNMRYKVLSVRPYASYKYANDLTARAIELCSEKPWFELFEFTICGSGPLFDRIARPLRRFSNVTLVNKFLTASEIKSMHDRHGVFLTPTRFDSQGVSACEAMSSGLVPLSTDIAAIPEFITHERSGLLGRPEAAADIATFFERLHYDPLFFQDLSIGAASSIREVSGPVQTVLREIQLIDNSLGAAQ